MQSLIEFKEFVDEVQQNNSRNYKLEVLKKYKENEKVKENENLYQGLSNQRTDNRGE